MKIEQLDLGDLSDSGPRLINTIAEIERWINRLNKNINEHDEAIIDLGKHIANIHDDIEDLENDAADNPIEDSTPADNPIEDSTPDGGHWVCSACGKDWGKGRTDWETGEDVHVCFSRQSHGGCGQWAVKWIPGETILPEHAHRIKDLAPEVVQAVTDNFDELIDTPDPKEDDMEKYVGMAVIAWFESSPEFTMTTFLEKVRGRGVYPYVTQVGRYDCCKPHPQSVELLKLRADAYRFEMNAETYKAVIDRLEAKVKRQRGNLNHMAKVEDRNTELETENKVLTERMAQYEEAVSRMETIIDSYDRLEPEDCDEGLISVNNLKGCLAALTSKEGK